MKQSMNYIEINKKAYDKLASQYEKRQYNLSSGDFNDQYWQDFIAKFTNPNDQVLELGPGSGRILRIMDNLNLDITAIELSKNMCRLCQNNAPEAKIINKNILECDFDYQFDFIFASAIICNFPKEDGLKVAKLMYKWLKTNCYIIVSTSIKKVSSQGVFIKKDYEGNIERFRKYFTEIELVNTLESVGFTIVDILYNEEKSRHKKWINCICHKL